MLEQTLKDLGEENLEVHLTYKQHLDGIVATIVWNDPKHCYTLKTERLVKFCELHTPVIPVDVGDIFDFNLSNVLGNMAAKVLEKVKRYTHEGENE